MLLETAKEEKLYADKAIICLPPQLAAAQIDFIPKLPDFALSTLPTVQTWMAGSIKFVVEYELPFWRKEGYSGMICSYSGIITEMYDHVNFEQNKFAFTGFLNSNYGVSSQENRKELVLRQLEKLLGVEASNPIFYFDKIWINEFVSSDEQLIHISHQNNGHPIFRESYLNDAVFFSGTESASKFPGYMEGAIIAAKTVFNQILKSSKND